MKKNNTAILLLLLISGLYGQTLHAQNCIPAKKTYELEVNIDKPYWDNGKQYYPKHSNIIIKVNGNKLKYDVAGTVISYAFSAQENAMLSTLFPDLNGATAAGGGSQQNATDNVQKSAEQAMKVANTKTDKAEVARKQNDDQQIVDDFYSWMPTVNQDISTLTHTITEWRNRYAQLKSIAAKDQISAADRVQAGTLKLAPSDQNNFQANIDQARKDLNDWTHYSIYYKTTLQKYIVRDETTDDPGYAAFRKKMTQQQILIDSLHRVDSMVLVINSFADQIADPDNDVSYLNVSDTANSDELHPYITFKDKATSQTQTKALPVIRLARYLNLGFGAGPVGVFIPHQDNFFTRNVASADTATGGTDSVKVLCRTRSSVSFALAAFMDLNYQVTPVTSIGVGVGGGLKIADDLDGNIYAGINVGFRVAGKALIALRAGAAWQKVDVLIDQLDNGGTYASSSIPSTGITTKRWQTGVFFGITASYLTKAISH